MLVTAISSSSFRIFLAGAVLAAAAAWLWTVPASGAGPDQQALLTGFIGSPSYKSILEKSFNENEPLTLKAECKAPLTVTSFGKPAIIEPPEFVKSASGWAMRQGAWIQPATMDRCGKPTTRRAEVDAIPGTMRLRITKLLPGEFAGDFRLESGAVSAVEGAVMNATKCAIWSQVVVLDTKLKSPVTPKGWKEAWTVQACGHVATVDVTYAASGPTVTAHDITTANIKVVR